MDTQAYLSRIHLQQAGQPDLEALTRLQRSHMQAVPFENFDVIGAREIRLEGAHLYHKVVVERRGGFCYELNGAFGELLSSLGFRVSRVSARVYNAQGVPGPEFDHMALLVRLDRTYLVDVGFGDSALTPLPLPDGQLEDGSGRYRLVAEEAARFTLQRDDPKGWRPEYDFSVTPRALADYGPMCRYHQTSPESPFTQRPVCTRATATGRVTLSPAALTISENGHKRRLPLSSAQDYYNLLKTYFDITLPAAQREKITLSPAGGRSRKAPRLEQRQ